ncbi:MAG TPA: hypothetical protein VHW01_04895, partial [Polyangiaceae bacterium]|nr:hypothetical protein [Polyangiaceae bacterium]
MKLAWSVFFPAVVVVGAVACGQSSSGNGSPPITSGGGGSSAAGSAGAATATPGGGGSGGSVVVGAAGAAGTAGAITTAGSGGVPTSAGAGGSAGSSGGASAGSAGMSGSGGSTGSGCTAPGTICWDFETGALPTGWSKYRDEFTGSILVDNTKAHKGTYALHAKDLTGGVLMGDGGPKKTIRYNLPANFGPVLWGRVWVYTDTGVAMNRPPSHSGLFNARYARPGTTDTDISKLDWYEVATYTQNYMSVWHPPEPPGYPEWVKVSGTPMVMNTWACLEWEFDGQNGTEAQAADPRTWLNGTELTWPMEFVFSVPATTVRPTQEKATNFSVLETGVYFYQGQ